VWFTFHALCEGPRGTRDFIDIATRFEIVAVSDVPVFDGTNDDAARRFVALVDEFYERRVKLVISAAAAPHALYAGRRLADQFHRTASRLVEMQSRLYLEQAHQP
jgi:cell division protein ZapE